MEDKFKYKYDDETRILYKYYYGIITLDDIYSTWDYAITNKLIPVNIRGFILDYTKANIDIKFIEFGRIADYYKKHLDIFKNKKIAIITQSQSDSIIPDLVETRDDGYFSHQFYTLEAAIGWVLS